MTQAQFLNAYAGIYEHSQWVAEKIWQQGVNEALDDVGTMAQAMRSIVDNASEEDKLKLINAHPDLAGKAAQTGELTIESNKEQAGAGIDQCTAQEFAKFQSNNAAYLEKFNFPFIMAVKGSDRQQILAAFETRLPNDYATEFERAIEEIHKIATFRLEALA